MTRNSGFVVGRDVGQFGRWFRLVVGVYFTALLTLLPLLQQPLGAGGALSFLGEMLLYLLLILGVYVIGFRLAGERILANMNPWIGTLLFLGPYSIIVVSGFGPTAFRVAMGVYINVSLIFNFAMSYGGCEVLAIPSLVFGKRYTVYCPYNAVDAVENALLIGGRADVPLAIVSTGITLFVGGYFLMVETLEMVRTLGIPMDVDNRWALLLLIPLGYLMRNAWVLYRENSSQFSRDVRNLLIGSGVLTVLTFLFVTGASYEPFWGVAMFGGGFLALAALLLRRMRSGPTTAEV